MKQIQFTFRDDKTLVEELRKIRQWVRSNLCSKVLIQIYTEILDRNRIEHVCETIGRMLPEAIYAGCSSNGNIVNGDFSGGSIAVICSLFEYPSTKIELLQYPMLPGAQENVAEKLAAEVEKRPWVKAVELLVTIRGMSMTSLCEGLTRVRKGVQIFGGGGLSAKIWKKTTPAFFPKQKDIRRKASFLSCLAEMTFMWRVLMLLAGSLSVPS